MLTISNLIFPLFFVMEPYIINLLTFITTFQFSQILLESCSKLNEVLYLGNGTINSSFGAKRTELLNPHIYGPQELRVLLFMWNGKLTLYGHMKILQKMRIEISYHMWATIQYINLTRYYTCFIISLLYKILQTALIS